MMTGIRLARGDSSIRYGLPNIAVRLVALALFVLVAIVLGVAIGTNSPSTTLILVGMGLTLVLGSSLKLGVRQVAFFSLFGSAVFFPHVLFNLSASHVFTALAVVIPSAFLVLSGRISKQVRLSDYGVLFLLFAQAFPLLVSRDLGPLIGIVAVTLGTYVGVRFARQSERMTITFFAGGSVVLALIGLMQRVDSLKVFVPFTPMRSGEEYVTSRAVGLFNNPNTFGVLLATAVVALLIHSDGNRKLWSVTLVLIAGLIASHSREALLGLSVAVLAMNIGRPRTVIKFSMGLAIAYAVGNLLFPETAAHFDPRGFETDSNLLGRIDQWQLARGYIPQSPLVGYGSESPLAFVDNAYLGWLLSGGVVGTVSWIAGLTLLTWQSRYWPVLIVLVGAGLLGNSFTGPSFSLLLIMAASNFQERPDRNVKQPHSLDVR